MSKIIAMYDENDLRFPFAVFHREGEPEEYEDYAPVGTLGYEWVEIYPSGCDILFKLDTRGASYRGSTLDELRQVLDRIAVEVEEGHPIFSKLKYRQTIESVNQIIDLLKVREI